MTGDKVEPVSGDIRHAFWGLCGSPPQGNGPYDGLADQANKSLHEARVVGRIVMIATRRAEIFVRGNTRSDASARMSDWNL